MLYNFSLKSFIKRVLSSNKSKIKIIFKNREEFNIMCNKIELLSIRKSKLTNYLVPRNPFLKFKEPLEEETKIYLVILEKKLLIFCFIRRPDEYYCDIFITTNKNELKELLKGSSLPLKVKQEILSLVENI